MVLGSLIFKNVGGYCLKICWVNVVTKEKAKWILLQKNPCSEASCMDYLNFKPQQQLLLIDSSVFTS